MAADVVVRTVLTGLSGVQQGLGQLAFGLSSLGIRSLSIAGAVSAIGLAFGKAVKGAEDFDLSQRKIQSILRATESASGKTVESIEELVRSVDDLGSFSEMREAAANLLTFQSIAGNTFDRTLRAASDLAAAGFGSVSSAAFMLGRAMEDPERGMMMLRRSGIILNETQKEQIKLLMATGQQLKAQEVLLEIVEKKVGGTAANKGGGLSGAFDNLTDSIELFGLGLVQKMGILDLFKKGLESWQPILDKLNKGFSTSGQFEGITDEIKTWEETLNRMSAGDSNRAAVQEKLNDLYSKRTEILEKQAKIQIDRDIAANDSSTAAIKREGEFQKIRSKKLDDLKFEQDREAELAAISDEKERQKREAADKAEAAVLKALELDREHKDLAADEIKTARERAILAVEISQATQETNNQIQFELQNEQALETAQKSRAKALDDQVKSIEDEIRLGKLHGVDLEVAKEILTAQNRLYDEQSEKVRDLTDDERERLEVMAKQRFAQRQQKEQAESLTRELASFSERAFDRIGDQITRMFVEGKQGALEWKNVFRAVLSELMQELIKLAIMNPIKNALFGNIAGYAMAPALFGGGGGLGSLFGMGRAALTTLASPIGFTGGGFDIASGATFYHGGGYVGTGGSRRGLNPALFMNAPRLHSGMSSLTSDEFPAILQRGEEVVPANKAGRGRGEQIVINQNLNFSIGVSQTVRAEVMAMMPRILNASKAAVADAARRGGDFRGAFK